MSEMVLLQGESTAVTIYEPATYKADAILIHGFTGSKEDFDYIAPLLAERGYRIYTFDNRGSHQSAHTSRPDGYTLESLTRDVVALVEHFTLSRPHLLGHSLGGVIAQRVASKSADLFASLTLMCSGPRARFEPQSAINILKILDGRSQESLWSDEVSSWYHDHPRMELMKTRWLAHDPASLKSMAQVLLDFTSVIPEIVATGIACHVLYGENDDAWPLSMQDDMARDLLAPVSVIRNAGHCPNEDQPRETAEAIADFWDQLSGN
jgi:pimeloyl-ACP methyl ester carboxylesterase